MSESFAAALRAELDAVVGRYEALVRALAEVGGREAAALSAENERLRAEIAARDAEIARLLSRAEAAERRAADAEADLSRVKDRADALSRAAQAAEASAQAFEEQFAAERRFAEAARDLGGTLLGEAVAAVLGRAVDTTSAALSALKARGLEATLAAALRDRGRSAGQAPLLDRERAALPALAAAAGCDLITPTAGARFTASAMEKAGTVSDPAEEGNVVSCAIPGLRRAGTEGALVFPRVLVATG